LFSGLTSTWQNRSNSSTGPATEGITIIIIIILASFLNTGVSVAVDGQFAPLVSQSARIITEQVPTLAPGVRNIQVAVVDGT
jgi:hypothetical protein